MMNDERLGAWPVKGLAWSYQAHDLSSLESFLKRYASLFPNELPHGIRFVRDGEPNDDFYMATDGEGGFWFRDVERHGFNSRRDLFGAFAKCARSRPMTPHEEYALEALWHEILHNRQTGMADVAKLSKPHPVRLLAEGLNQWVARLTYPTLIERLGGAIQHQDWILENGYGYRLTVTRLRRIAAHVGLNERDLTGELANINRDRDLLRGPEWLAGLFHRKSGADVAALQAALEAVSKPRLRFEAALGAIKSPL